MRIEATAISLSWIPSESLSGLLRPSFDMGLTHYDPPPPGIVAGTDDVDRLHDEDRFRFANVLHAWIDVSDASITASGWGRRSGIVMGSTTVRVAQLGTTFRGYALPVLQPPPATGAGSVTFTQTVGGRTGLPLPRPVTHSPFAQWQAPIVWTTLALTLHMDGRSEVSMPGASAFPRHWVYGADGVLALKSGVTDQSTWVAHSFGARTPWGEQDSSTLVVAAESALERQLSSDLMQRGRRPQIRRLSPGTVLTRQGEPGRELFLVLDGVLSIDVDGERLAEVGPGAVLGERAVIEGGPRTSTLVAVTPVRLAVASGDAIDLDRLRTLADLHRREDQPGESPGTPR